MHIKVLGTRGEVESSAPYHSKHSGVLVDETILLDLGEKEYLDYKPECIFITHLHPDHAFFVTEPAKIDIPVYAPETSNTGHIIAIADSIEVNTHLVTPVPTHHSKKVKSVAYLVERDGQKFLYTGDVIWINKEYHHLFTDLSLVITDGSYIRKGGLIKKDKETGRLYGHTGIPNLVDLFKSFTQHILFLHFGNWFYDGISTARKKFSQISENNGVNILVGYDGMEINLNDLG